MDQILLKLPSHPKESRGWVGLFIPSYLMDVANGLLNTHMSSEISFYVNSFDHSGEVLG